MDTFDLSPIFGLSVGFNRMSHSLDEAFSEADGSDAQYGTRKIESGSEGHSKWMLPPRAAMPVVRHIRDAVIMPPTPDEVRIMIGCSDRGEDEPRRRLSLFEAGIRRRHPAMTSSKIDAAVARITRAMSPPMPPSDGDWEAIRRGRVML